jgi:chemotaxis protein methyltransferase CheR
MVNKGMLPLSRDLIYKFSIFLTDKLGIHFPLEKWRELEKKLIILASDLKFNDVDSCLNWFLQFPLTQEKIDLLAHHFTIGETYFFRDQNTFKALEESILPNLIRQRAEKDRFLRIWSAACCTGEEPYSIAILLDRLIPDIHNWTITIIGTDLNLQFLNKAEQGQYKEWSFRNTPQSIKNQYFTKKPDGFYEIHSKIKQMVKFFYFNLVEDSQSFMNMDLILCNNVLIYFSSPQIQKVVSLLERSLGPSGWLLVSAIEVPFIQSPDLRSSRIKETTFFQRKSLGRSFSSPHPKPPPSPQKKSHLLPSKTSRVQKQSYLAPAKETKKESINSLSLYEKGEYLKIIQLLEPSPHISIDDLIILIKSYTNLGRLEQAQAWCQKGFKEEKLNPLLYFLHANVLQEMNRLAEAIFSLKKALYLDSNFIMAHFSLGQLLKKENQTQEAQRHFRNAKLLLNQRKKEEPLLGAEEVTPQQLEDILDTLIL